MRGREEAGGTPAVPVRPDRRAPFVWMIDRRGWLGKDLSRSCSVSLSPFIIPTGGSPH